MTTEPINVTLKIENETKTELHAFLNIQNIDKGFAHVFVDVGLQDDRVIFLGYAQPYPLSNEHHVQFQICKVLSNLRTRDKKEGGDLVSHVWNEIVDKTMVKFSKLKYETHAKELTPWLGEIAFQSELLSFVNFYRRILLTRLETLAMTNFSIKGNNSVLCDEILIHRLGQLPIHLSEDEIVRHNLNQHPEKVEISLQVEFDSLESQNDYKSYKSHMLVTSKHVKINMGKIITLVNNEECSSIQEEEFAYPIVLLNPGESIDIKCTCETGCGLRNPRFSPISAIGYINSHRSCQGDNDFSSEAEELYDVTLQVNMIGQMNFEKCFNMTRGICIDMLRKIKI